MADIINLVAKTGSPTINGNAVMLTREQVVGTSKYVTEGLWYWEVTLNAPVNSYGYIAVGVGTSSMTTYDSPSSFYLWNNNSARTNVIYNNTSIVETISATSILTEGDTIGIVLDATNKTIQFFFKDRYTVKYQVNNMTEYSPVFLLRNTTATSVITANFGESDFLLYPNIRDKIADEYKDNNNDLTSYNGAISKLAYKIGILLKSNNKIYSFKSEKILYKTYMTSNTAPSPLVASASSIISNSYQAWRAFNGENNSTWWQSQSSTTTGWVQLDFGENKRVNTVHISSPTTVNSEFFPQHFQILGSNDGVDFDKLGEYYVLNWEQGERKTFKIERSNFRYYRVDVFKTISNKNIAIGLIEFELNENILINIPYDSIENFKKYGFYSVKNFDFINVYENYILQDAVSENADGLWVQELNKKPSSIKLNN